MAPLFRCVFVVLAATAAWLPVSGERVRVTVLSTTDLHGNLLPYDYFTKAPASVGLAKVATLVRQARVDAPSALLIDVGDTLQGSPLAYVQARVLRTTPDPMMAAMNAMGYASMTVGNHEYNFGPAVREKARSEASFPWLSANTHRSGTNEPAFTPYVIREVNGVRVGILGLTTPGVPGWENPANYAGLEFRDAVAEARRWTDVLRGREGVDLVVAAVHMGLEENLARGPVAAADAGAENAALAIARAVPAIDVMFMGHTHRDVSGLVVNGVLMLQAGRWGDRLARADITLDRPEGGRWAVVAKAGRTVEAGPGVDPDPAILAIAQPYHAETERWLSREIGRIDAPLSAADGHVADNAVVDLVHRVQLDAGRADISFAANFNPRVRLAAGPVTVREIAALYVYDNTLVVVELTGAEVKEALEHASRFFLANDPTRPVADLIDRSLPGYFFDTAEGVSYELDLTREPGDRIRGLSFGGAPIDPARRFRVAVNNYRQNGGGGYEVFRKAPVLERSSREIRDLIVDWVERSGAVPHKASDNWRIVR